MRHGACGMWQAGPPQNPTENVAGPQTPQRQKGKRKLFLDHFNAPKGTAKWKSFSGQHYVMWSGMEWRRLNSTWGMGLWSGYESVAKEYWPMAQFTFINIEEGRGRGHQQFFGPHHLNKNQYLIIIVAGHAMR